MIAPMHGQMLEVLVRVGDVVQVGEKLAILEAMKMQHEIVANVAGSVTEVLVKPGQQLAADTLILVIEPSDPT
ncbi:MAG: biotin/lipoyl-containing protein [Pseudomonadales bacterium]